VSRLKLIVTGHTGFIGRHLLHHLGDAEVVGICRTAPADLSIKSVSLDIRKINENQLKQHKQEFKDADAIIHLAGYRPIARSDRLDLPYENLSANVIGTFNVLLLAQKFGIGRIILGSSKSVYGHHKGYVAESTVGRPPNNYGKSKLLAENLCRIFTETYDLKCAALRFASVYGPGMSASLVYAEFLNKALNDKAILVHMHRSGFEALDLIYVDDVATAIVKTLHWKQNSSFDTFNIGTGTQLTTYELAKQIVQVVGSKSPINVIHTNETRLSVRMSVKKARRILDWVPRFDIGSAIIDFLPRWQFD
jgi:nucleoside-diphosphate-sugar epimerase